MRYDISQFVLAEHAAQVGNRIKLPESIIESTSMTTRCEKIQKAEVGEGGYKAGAQLLAEQAALVGKQTKLPETVVEGRGRG